MHSASAATATLLSLAFAAATFERWIDRRARHHLAWTAALCAFAGGAAALWLGASVGWDGPTFRAFYLLGAIVNVPLLALGTVYLIGNRSTADRIAAATALVLAFAVGVVVTTPLEGSIDPAELPRGADVFGVLPRVMAAVFSSLGALVVFGGSLLSILSPTRRRRGGRRLVAANVSIAAGTIALSAGGLFNSVVDEMDAFALSLVIGIALLFGGFLLTSPRVVTEVEPDTETVDNVLDLTARAERPA